MFNYQRVKGFSHPRCPFHMPTSRRFSRQVLPGVAGQAEKGNSLGNRRSGKYDIPKDGCNLVPFWTKDTGYMYLFIHHFIYITIYIYILYITIYIYMYVCMYVCTKDRLFRELFAKQEVALQITSHSSWARDEGGLVNVYSLRTGTWPIL